MEQKPWESLAFVFGGMWGWLKERSLYKLTLGESSEDAEAHNSSEERGKVFHMRKHSQEPKTKKWKKKLERGKEDMNEKTY